MTRAEKITQAYGLRYVCGWNQKAIARELGVSEYTVSVYLNPDAAARYAATAKAKPRTELKRREWADQNSRLTCECGGRMATWSKYTGGERCKSCHRMSLRIGDARSDMPLLDQIVSERESRDDRVFEAWHRMLQDGSSVADVARLLRVGKPVLLQHVQRLREEGRDLPYRHQVAA